MVCSFNTTSIKVYILEWLQYNYPLKCAWKNSVPLLVCLPPEGYTVLKIMGWGMKITSPFSTSLIFKKSSSLLVWIFIFDKFSCVSSRDFGRDGYVRLLRLYTAFETLFISIRLQTVLDHRLLEEFEDTKGVIRIRKSKKHRQAIYFIHKIDYICVRCFIPQITCLYGSWLPYWYRQSLLIQFL